MHIIKSIRSNAHCALVHSCNCPGMLDIEILNINKMAWEIKKWIKNETVKEIKKNGTKKGYKRDQVIKAFSLGVVNFFGFISLHIISYTTTTTTTAAAATVAAAATITTFTTTAAATSTINTTAATTTTTITTTSPPLPSPPPRLHYHHHPRRLVRKNVTVARNSYVFSLLGFLRIRFHLRSLCRVIWVSCEWRIANIWILSQCLWNGNLPGRNVEAL